MLWSDQGSQPITGEAAHEDMPKALVAACMLAAVPTLSLGGCSPQVLKSIPPDYSIPYGKVVYIENDGRCAEGRVIKVTGGESNQDVERTYECVERPG
jgi:Family of unknown function (DUF6719)